jgi:hypothetical protein
MLLGLLRGALEKGLTPIFTDDTDKDENILKRITNDLINDFIALDGLIHI